MSYRQHCSPHAGLRLLSQDETTDASEARALGFRTDVIDIYSNSWGPYDDGFVVDGPGPLLSAVMETGTREVGVSQVSKLNVLKYVTHTS